MLLTPPTPPDSSPAPPRTFFPDQATTARLIEDLSCPDLTIREIAQRYRTDLTQLTLFMMSQQGAAHVAQFEQAAAARARLTAASHLPRLVNALVTMLDAYVFEADKLMQDTPRNRIFREHQRVNARRAAHLLFRVSNYHPRASTPQTSTPSTSSPPTGSPTVREGSSPSTTPPPSLHPHTNPPAPTPPTPTSPPAQAEGQTSIAIDELRLLRSTPPTSASHAAPAPNPLHDPGVLPAPVAVRHASGHPEACHPTLSPAYNASG